MSHSPPFCTTRTLSTASVIAMVLLLVSCDQHSGSLSLEPGYDNGTSDDVIPDDATNDDTSSISVDEAVALYDEGVFSRDQLLETLEQNLESTPPSSWEGTLKESLYFPEGSYEITGDFTIRAGSTVVLDAGVEWVLDRRVSVEIEGRILALGDEASPIVLRGEEDRLYTVLRATGGPDLFEHVRFSYGERLLQIRGEGEHRIHRASFDAWSTQALDLVSTDVVHVTDSRFGLDTPDDFALGEAVHGVDSPVRIEGSTFGYIGGYLDAIDLGDCELPDIPVLASNHFMGGEDDAIDLDDCTAIVVGNLIENYRPEDLDSQVQNMNGGGVTGSGSSTPLLINNVIRNCFHAVGFKDGAEPLLLHNTITDNHIGVTLYQSSSGANAPHGTLVNNVLWNNRNWFDDSPQDVLLNGRWWPNYSQESGDQATLDAHHNLASAQLEGTQNLAGDPLLLWENGIPFPASGSPAIDSAANADLATGPFPAEEVWSWLEYDCLGQPRPQTDGVFQAPDRGAVEIQP